MRERLPWWVHITVVLRFQGPDKVGFWGNTKHGISRRTMVISGEWWVCTRWWSLGVDGTHLEPSKDLSLP